MLKTSTVRVVGSFAVLLAMAIPLTMTARTRRFPPPTDLTSAGASRSPAPGARIAAAQPPAPGIKPRAAAAALTGSVTVEPNGGIAYQARPQVFTIWNTGTSTATFTLTATCTGAATSCAVSPGSVTVAGGASAQATVTFGVGGSGMVQLTASGASGSATGFINVEALTSGFRAYHVRSHCMTVALPGSAASECGDLRLSHPLPSVRTLNRVWTPALVYNSGHAQPRLRFVFTYTPDPAKAAPDSLTTNVRLANGRLMGARKWKGWAPGSWAPGEIRRLVYTEDAADLPTATYVVTIEVTVWRANVAEQITAPGITVPFVNRSASPYGAGWWVSGVEQLVHLADGKKFWVDAQGNIALYGAANDTTYVAWNGERPDTLKKRVNAQGAIRWVRLLPGGARAIFGATGTMDSTVNRLGQVTAFAYSGSTLTTITVPGGAVYTFEYGATTRPRLWRVRLNNGGVQRAVDFDQDADPRIRNLKDPDGALTTLAYPAGDTTQKRVVQRMDPRRLTWSTYAYDWTGKLTRGQLDMGAAGEADDIIVQINPGETRGAAPTAVPFDSAYTLVDGPRPDSDARDVMRFWIQPNYDTSIPYRIVDALGGETVIAYADARFPYLSTRVDGPVPAGGTRQTTYATYDRRGNLASQVVVNPLGDGRDATTRYERTNAAWPDAVTRVTMPTGEVTDFGYDAAGNRSWQQDGRGTPSRVQVAYNTAGQPVTVTLPTTRNNAAASSTLAYDALGNLRAARSAVGNYTLMYGDALGRDTLVITPTTSGDSASVRNGGVRQRVVYDLAGRVTQQVTLAPSLNYAPAETLSVVTQYDSAGLVRSVARRSGPDIHSIGWITSQFRYDAAGRRTVEIAPPWSFADTTWYDMAGNPVTAHTRRGGLITWKYDALGRLVRRDEGGGADIARFTYDAQGNLLSATNNNARITRTYYPGGLVKTDSTRIRTYTPSQVDSVWTGYTAHVYGLAYQYDLGGRRTRLTYPANLVAGSGITGLRDHADYGYDAVTGNLAWVQGLGADTRYDYRYDTRDQPDSTYLPGGLKEWYLYDDEGRMTRRYTYAPAGGSWFTGGTLRDDYYSYDGRGKMGATATVIGAGGIQQGASQGNSYDGMGNLIGSSHAFDSPYTSESWRSDALGNRTDVVRFGPTSPGGVTYASQYEAGSGLLKKTVAVGDTSVVADTTLYWYNYGGDNTGVSEYGKVMPNPRFGSNISEPEYHQRRVETASYFDNEGRLAEFRRLTNQENNAGLRIRETYAYDALGRRVWRAAYRGWDPGTLTQRDTICLRPSPPSECQGFVERTVWDGEQVVAEMRSFTDPNGYATDRESDTGYYHSVHYGRVLYTHAGGIDQPAEIVRMDVDDPFAAVPHANWRGTVDVLTLTGARYAQCGPQVGAALGTQVECFPFDLESVSAFGETAPRNYDGSDPGPRSWSGSLVMGSRDASGMLYRRNRYIDPASGRFTQEDPIGLAGGINLYGFADGDPIRYSDPFGLSASDDLGGADPGDLGKLVTALAGELSMSEDAVRRAMESRQGLHLAAGTSVDLGGGTTLTAGRGGSVLQLTGNGASLTATNFRFVSKNLKTGRVVQDASVREMRLDFHGPRQATTAEVRGSRGPLRYSGTLTFGHGVDRSPTECHFRAMLFQHNSCDP